MDSTNKPVFIDGCRHANGDFIGTVHYQDGMEMCQADVYVFEGVIFGQMLCIRTGDKPWDYASAGTVADFLRSAAHPQAPEEYKAAAELINNRFVVRLVKRQTPLSED